MHSLLFSLPLQRMNQLLFINNVGGMEVILILIFVLMFFGAKSIPGLARSLGRGMREIQNASDEIKREIRSTGESIKNDLKGNGEVEEIIQSISAKPDQLLDQIYHEVRKVATDIENPISDAQKTIEDNLNDNKS